MFSNTYKSVYTYTQRHSTHAVAFVVGVCVGGAMFWNVFPRHIAEAPTLGLPTTQSVATSSAQFARSAPVRLRAPSIGLDTFFEAPLRLNPDKTVEVPDSFEKVGWYEYGATPGEVGPATILGHVDSYKGPAVFYNLRTLSVGDEVSVERADGTTAVFVVEKTETYDQDVFPAEKVYGPTDYPALRLVTCSGKYDKKSQKYSHNLVVYARLKE
jgi:hypothetical protein